MSHTRLEFKQLLDTIDESATVYGQDPGNVSMTYPAIRYVKDEEEVFRADNVPYAITDRYQVTVIETDPNTPVAKKLRELPMCEFNRTYVTSNLNHTVYSIYF